MPAQPVLETINTLAKTAGLPAFDSGNVRHLSRTGNNQILIAERNGKQWIIKRYWSPAPGQNPRLERERAFYAWAARYAPACIPKALAWDLTHATALFEHLPGKPPEPGQSSATDPRPMVEFIRLLNQAQPDAQQMPPGTEACFSVAAHLRLIADRVARLENQIAPTDTDAREWVAKTLRPLWNHTLNQLRSRPANQQELAPNSRCVSPSDFGWHNALLTSDGRCYFIDFEHAGIDDPAKLACDMFFQPALPMGAAAWNSCLSQWDKDKLWGGNWLDLTHTLLPAYRIKWACILLNEFTHSGMARRRFANANDLAGQTAQRKATQLAKAKHLLAH